MSRVFSFPDGALAGKSDPAGPPSSGVEPALDDLRAGRMVLVTHDTGHAALAMVAERASPDAVDFMTTHARGALRVALNPERFEELRIPTGRDAEPPDGASAGMPVELVRDGQTSGLLDESVSAWAETVRALGDPRTRASDLTGPGQVFPVRTETDRETPGRRAGLLAAGLALAALTGLYPAALVCGVLEPSARAELVGRHGITVVGVDEALGYQPGRDLRRDVEVLLPTRFGEFRLRVYLDEAGEQTHLALIAGRPEGKKDVLAHVHSPCLIGDVLRSLRCDCGVLLEAAMQRVQTEGEGVIVYARAEARHIAPEDVGLCRADRRSPAAHDDYAVGAGIFRDLNLGRVRLLTDPGR